MTLRKSVLKHFIPSVPKNHRWRSWNRRAIGKCINIEMGVGMFIHICIRFWPEDNLLWLRTFQDETVQIHPPPHTQPFCPWISLCICICICICICMDMDLWTTQVSKCSPTCTPLLIWRCFCSFGSTYIADVPPFENQHSDPNIRIWTDTILDIWMWPLGKWGIFSGAEWQSDACERWKLPDFSQTTDTRHLLLFCTGKKVDSLHS